MSKRTNKTPTAPRTHLPTVCVVEDDDATRDTLRMLLEEEGYPVVEAADGLVGYHLLTQADERLIAVVDHKMPRMDGCDLLERMEQDATLRARHTFIMLSASPKRAEQDCGDTLEELDAPLVPKPFSIDEVLDAVARAVQRLDSPPSAAVQEIQPAVQRKTVSSRDLKATGRRAPRR